MENKSIKLLFFDKSPTLYYFCHRILITVFVTFLKYHQNRLFPYFLGDIDIILTFFDINLQPWSGMVATVHSNLKLVVQLYAIKLDYILK